MRGAEPSAATRKDGLGEKDRAPWLRRLNAVAREQVDTAGIACSALTRVYRDVLRTDAAVEFIHLVVTEELALDRLTTRGGHFFPRRWPDRSSGYSSRSGPTSRGSRSTVPRPYPSSSPRPAATSGSGPDLATDLVHRTISHEFR
ncbi:hypothetical protein AB6N35_05925 [Dietzia cinnamea]|uniref:gluconokinase n=1 Tax=Dietzia cinnamea TaxID=321318 RepID=A0ABV3YH93_9ACTN|nr:hypothetical protein [Dietzia cinnamea]KZO58712.1 hypothetical protein A2U19_11240 [Dietzia maris]MCT1638532.1 hypothetical protein [Dietzia cinnamea]MCT1884581.1 hypothetical protein [Dietzia cinnamea]MCT2098079.1 hypothetical protein [Dietzia cinnamea]